MIKRLTKHGNSHALVIDKSVLELLKIGPETLLELSTDGCTLLVTPIREQKHRKRLLKIAGELESKYASALKRLAE